MASAQSKVVSSWASHPGLHPRPQVLGGAKALPLRPIWPGFAVNTLFYAALLWLLIPGPFVLRRFIRV